MAGAPFIVKQGAQLQLAGQLVQDDGTPVNITGATLFSEIRDPYGALVATPTLAITNAALGQFSYSVLSSTAWPTGQVKTDIYVSLNGTPFFTDTFMLTVAPAVTNPADMA